MLLISPLKAVNYQFLYGEDVCKFQIIVEVFSIQIAYEISIFAMLKI